jgi:hypothetical protein
MAINTIQTYLDLITSAHQSKPNFVATVSLSVELQVQVQDLLSSMIPLFDLGTPPVGNQLDILGQWAGVSSEVNLNSNTVGFTWDGTNAAVGWDSGVWAPTGSGTSIVELPDSIYLLLILAKIGANSWDGTTTQAYEIYNEVFAPYIVLISDNCNMSYDLGIIGGIVPPIILALFTEQLIPLKPEGVEIASIWTSTTTGPAFCWDSNSTNAKGWDTGIWLEQIG